MSVQDEFEVLFRRHYACLAESEARSVIREVIDEAIRNECGVNGRINEAEFTSMAALIIFKCFDVLFKLEPEWAVQLTAEYPELAAALQRYPKGLTAVEEESAIGPVRDEGGFGLIVGLGGVDGNYEVEYVKAMMDARRTGDFSGALAAAHKFYKRESRQNGASRAFWHSCGLYQQVFHELGRLVGEAAVQKLKEVPGKEVRLFAKIELAAGLCGLPNFEPGWVETD